MDRTAPRSTRSDGLHRSHPTRQAGRPARLAAGAAAGLLGLVVLFQWAIVLGAPWGEFTQGGGTVGRLPTTGRLAAAASSVLLLTMASAISARTGQGPLRSLPPRAITVLVWLTTVYSGLSVLLNLATPSVKERAVWAPISTVILMLVVAAMLLTRTPRGASRRRIGRALVRLPPSLVLGGSPDGRRR